MPARGRGLVQGHHFLAARVGQGAEEHAADHAEDGGVGADAEAEGERDHGGEAGVAAQAARAVLDVLDEGFQEAHAPGVAALLLDALDAAEAHGGAAAGLVGAHPLALLLLGLQLEVEPQLLVQLALDAVAGEEGAQEMADAGKGAHGVRPAGARA